MATKSLPDDAHGPDYVDFGDVARGQCHQQCQYAARNLAGEHGSLDLGSDLRWAGNTADYHGLLIHKDDAVTFVARYKEFRSTGLRSWLGEKAPE